MRFRILFPEFADGVVGIAFAAAADLGLGNLDTGKIGKAETAELQPLVRGRAPLFQFFMRGVLSGMIKKQSGRRVSSAVRAASRWPRWGGLKLPP